MQPQDNDFPMDQVQGGVAGDGANPPAHAGNDAVAPLSAGATFQPQAGGISAIAPSWQNDMHNDSSQLYSQPDAGASPNNPADAMRTDMQNANNMTEANPLMHAQQQAQQDLAGHEQTQPTGQGPQMTQKEPIQYETTQQQPNQASNNISHDPYEQNSNLPGSVALGEAVAGVNQQDQMPAQPVMPQAYQPEMQQQISTPPPQPPKKSKKWVFILLGIIIALGAIGGGAYYFFVTRKATTVTPTPTQTPTPTPTPTPTSGPATPPAGYETISKQCYSFALYIPNTVPKDQACSFAESTFGNKQISKISVETSTNEYKSIDDFLGLFKSTVTLVSENKIKLNDLDATQIIYKFTDGRTYSKVFVLLVGKSYQQDGKPVTGLAVTTSYQDQFDLGVTNNVLDTWRWN